MMIYTGMLIAGITAGYICLERHRPVEGILLLAGIAGSFAAISEQMGKEYGMTRKQLRVMLLFLMVGFFNFALNYNRCYTDETLLKRDQTAFKEMKILHVREQAKYIAYEGTADIPSGRRRILCRDYSENRTPLSIGTVVRVSGELTLPEEARNPGCFNYRLHLKGKGIVYTVNAQGIRAHRISRHPADVFHRKLQQRRNDFLDKFRHRPAVRGFLKGILFGDRGELDEETYREFTENGTAHILAVSGLHVGFLIALLNALARKRKYWKITMGIFLVLILYGELTEWSPSTLRAVLIAILSMSGMYLNRAFDLTTGTAAAALGVLMVQPYQLFQTGFIMSYLAILGMAFLTRPLSHFLGEGLASLMSLQIMMIPFQIYAFNRFNPLTIVINLPIIFLASVLVPCGVILFLFSGLLSSGGIPAESISRLTELLVGLNRMLHMNGSLSGSFTSAGTAELILFNLILLFLSSELFRVMVLRRDGRNLRCLFLILAIPALLLVLGFRNPLAGAEVVFIDVGQGDAIHLRSGGKNVLIDGGGDSKRNVGTGTLQPYLLKNGARTLDLSICTHLHMDHFRGVQELSEVLPVKAFALPGVYRGLPETPKGARLLRRGEVIRISDEMSVKVLWPESEELPGGMTEAESSDENLLNGVYRIDYRGIRILVTGDLLEEGEADMVKYYAGTEELRCDVLKVAHHGSHSSSSEAFLDAVRPKAAVIQVGKKNRYGHPHGETLEKLKRRNIPVYRNDRHGAIGLRVRRNKILIDRMIN